MFEAILNLLIPIANIIEKNQPGFAATTQEKIAKLRTEYLNELGKPSEQIDDALLDSLELQLCDLLSVCNTALQPTNVKT